MNGKGIPPTPFSQYSSQKQQQQQQQQQYEVNASIDSSTRPQSMPRPHSSSHPSQQQYQHQQPNDSAIHNTTAANSTTTDNPLHSSSLVGMNTTNATAVVGAGAGVGVIRNEFQKKKSTSSSSYHHHNHHSNNSSNSPFLPYPLDDSCFSDDNHNHYPLSSSPTTPYTSAAAAIDTIDEGEVQNVAPTTTTINPLSSCSLTLEEIMTLKQLLAKHSDGQSLAAATTVDSDYPEFGESTHAWAVFADDPKKRAGPWERSVGVLIILFQLFAYRLFANEAIQDFQNGLVPVMMGHHHCIEMEGQPNEQFQCEAEFTDTMDAFVAFFMLAIFLTGDMLQAGRAIRDAPWGMSIFFACLAGIEVVCAFMAASIAVSYHLFIGEVTDAVEVGVGLLFIRELSQRTYSGLRYGKTKQYRNFLIVLSILVTFGLIMDPLTAKIFAGYIQ